MRTKLSRWLLTLLLLAMAVATTTFATASGDDVDATHEEDRETLLRLDLELAHSQIVDRDPTFISRVALENLRVLTPGGMFENKDQVIAGLRAWDARDVTLTGTEVLFQGDVAIVMGRIDIDGTLRPIGRWGPLKYMSTWVKKEGEWRLFARSLTPCIDKLIEVDRC